MRLNSWKLTTLGIRHNCLTVRVIGHPDVMGSSSLAVPKSNLALFKKDVIAPETNIGLIQKSPS